jgi:hypothetical protein
MIGGISCDLEMALDSVKYDIPLFQLQYYGIKGTDKTLYEPYTCITDIRKYHYMKRIYKNFPFPTGQRSSVVFRWVLSCFF